MYAIASSMGPFHRFDLHVHTEFTDGQIDLDAEFQLLIQNKIEIVGFADHIHPGSGCFSKERIDYRKAVLHFYEHKYRSAGIRVLVGGEIDILEGGRITLPRGVTVADFDYILVSKHHTLPKQLNIFQKIPKFDRWLWKHDLGLRLNKPMWFKGLHNCFIHHAPDILAHPQWNMPGYMSLSDYKRLAWLAMKYGVAIELNPNFRSHHGSKRDRQDILRVISKYKHAIKVTLGSDFHGFKKDKLWEMGLSQEMYDEVQEFDLQLLDPHKFLPENRAQYDSDRAQRLKKIAEMAKK